MDYTHDIIYLTALLTLTPGRFSLTQEGIVVTYANANIAIPST